MMWLEREYRRLVVAALGVGLGAFAIAQTTGMSELGRVFPITAGLVAVAAGLGVLLQAILGAANPPAEAVGTDYFRAGLLSATLLIWALLLDVVGFLPSSSMAVVAVAAITRREPISFRSVLLHAVAGVGLVVGFSVLLSEVLNVRLP